MAGARTSIARRSPQSASAAALAAATSLTPTVTKRNRQAWQASLALAGHLVTVDGTGRMDEQASLRALQAGAGLAATGVPDEATVERLRAEVSHRHVVTSRGRTAKVQELLDTAGFPVAAPEAQARTFGDASADALRRFQAEAGLSGDAGLLTRATLAALRNRALSARLSTRAQTAKLQRTLLRAARVRGLELSIDGTEMKTRSAGPSTRAAIQALQQRLGLPATGEVDTATFERVSSVAASRSTPAVLGRPQAQDLTRVPKVLRLNMRNKHVPALQRALAFAGHPVTQREFTATTFGASTRRAVLAFQATQGLPQTGAADTATLKSLNAAVAAANPATATVPPRLRGSVRDATWAGMAGVRVEVSTNPLRGAAVALGSRTTLVNGFYDLPYTAPVDPGTGTALSPLHLHVTFTAPDGRQLGTRDLLDPTSIAWVNLTLGDYPYQGPSRHDVLLSAVRAAGVPDVGTLSETSAAPDVSRLAQASGLSQDDVMRLVLAHWAAAVFAASADSAGLDDDVCFAFLAQNLPASLPDGLLAQTHDWTLIDQLVQVVTSGIAFTDPAVQDGVLDSALSANLVPVTLAGRRPAVREALTAARRRFTLDQPLLAGNGTMRAVLAASSVPAPAFGQVADAFVTTGGIGERFWQQLRADPATFGGAAGLDSFEAGVDVGAVTKNFAPMAAVVRAAFTDPAQPALRSPRDLARLSVAEWQALIPAGDGGVPAGTDGDTLPERRATYAATMAAQAQKRFPTVALTAEVGRGNALNRMGDITALVDAHPDLELRRVNIDTFALERSIVLDPEVHTELRVLQRVHRLAPTAATAAALLENGLHSSVQLVSLGAGEVVRRLGASGVDERTALTVQGYAQFQYAQVLARLGEFRSEMQAAMPAALSPQVITTQDRADLLGEIPDLELLFGPVDVCDCPHCASVYGPGAYLADVLRFLDAHPANTGGGTVRDVLARRRPDLSGIELSCVNTETPLPYVDLVNETLEAAVTSGPPTAHQTTWTAPELRAAPEHLDSAAYETLRTSDVPISSSYDLWQEQTRIFLRQLGVPRWRLMQTYRGAGTPEALADTGAEYFAISSHESTLITTPASNAARQGRFWGFDASRAQIPVPAILAHSGLTYPQLLLSLQAGWLTPPGQPQVVLARPPESADLAQQELRNLSPDVLDRLHRLTRLSRHLPWDVWEVDLLLRATRIGAGTLDGTALARLHAAAEVSERLKVSPEALATWFDSVPTHGHPGIGDPTDDDGRALSAYARIFANRAVLNLPDPGLSLPLAAGSLDDHRPALLAALAVSDNELDALLARTGPALTLEALSALAGWAQLARALRLRVGDLLALADLAAPVIADPFAEPGALLAFLDVAAELRSTSASVTEIEYLLQARPDSPYAATDEALTASLTSLRESLRTNPALAPDGQIATHFAASLGLPAADTALLLGRSDATGRLLDAFLDPQFTATDAAGDYLVVLTPAGFARAYEVCRRLQKTARVARLLALTGEDLAWVLEHGPDVGALRLLDLPVDTAPATPLVASWLALLRWSVAARRLDQRAAQVAAGAAATAGARDLVAAAAAPGAAAPAVRALAAGLLGIDTTTLAELDADGLIAYRDPVFLARLLDAADAAARLGVAPATARDWAQREQPGGPSERAAAAAVIAAAKAKYDPDAWLGVLTPIQDALRESRRDALVAHLLEQSVRTQPESVIIDGQEFANPAHWRSSEDLLSYFLVDVEMSACQQTSRVKQAIGSVQMFVQRSFLNLEKPQVVVTSEERADEASLDSWRQWRWMKSYRLWEANRKIFLYPENWIQPELRDDKTPFFVDLEQELLQSEITDENAETALRHYLEKLQEVSDLDVAGIYHEIDDDNPFDALPPTLNQVHVIGRSRTEPAQYYYRRFDLNTVLWSPWEKIDLDITGEQVVPVVYNRVLHLFWLQIAQTPQKSTRQPVAQPTTGTRVAPEPPRQMELKLSWSTRQGSAWTKRQVAPNTLVHPWQRPVSSYTLRPRYAAAENQLLLDLYISTSAQFNDRQFWDPFTDAHHYVTATRFDETVPAWLSSSFVFDGRVVAVRLKGLAGQYHLAEAAGTPSDALANTTSYAYVQALNPATVSWLKPMGPGQKADRIASPDGLHLEAGRMVNNVRSGHTTWLSVLENGASVPLLTAAQQPFSLVQSPHRAQYDTAPWEHSPFFFVDAMRAYMVRSRSLTVSIDSTTSVQRLQYTFSPFAHPYAALFLRELNRSGVGGLLNRKLQRFPEQYPPEHRFDFASYAPVAPAAIADEAAAHDSLDFDRSGAMAVYNWELFFHVPFLIATKLMANQRFEEAMDWFHRVFDPTNTEALSAPQRFWVTRPFFEQTSDDYRKQRIESLLADISGRIDEVREWKNHPFVPDAIARLRPVAYQKAVVMRYIDNLVAWGDQLFRQDTIESINEASMLYLLAGELLGRRPEHVPAPARPAKTYHDLAAGGPLDGFGNASVEVQLENFTDHPTLVFTTTDGDALPVMQLQYFGVPANDQLLAYWDTVADRLFKIRNCMDLSGTVRQLDLFEPPLDPAALVRAVAAGVDLASVLGDTPGAGSPYRYRTLQAKALEFAADVRAMGERMLALLERRDAEELSRLYAGNEVSLQTSLIDVRRAQVNEAAGSRAALELGRDSIQARVDYFSAIPRMNDWEIGATVAHGLGIISQIVATVLNAVSGGASLVPSFTVGAAGFGGSPVVTATYGGANVSDATSHFAALFQGLSTIAHSGGSMLETQGGYTRADNANRHQADVAGKDLAQLEGLIAAAMLREGSAGYELASQQVSLENARAVDEYLRTKYTSEELFDWTVSQLSTVYFQAYQLAFDLARRAERAYRFELNDQTSAPFIRFGYWDSLKKGLLSGDRLINDLRRLDAAFLERNTRRLEALTHVSLATLMPDKLLELTTRGTTTIDLAEWVLAMEHPGWINQRLISVAVSVPCTAGPFVGVHAGLTLTKAVVRVNDSTGAGFGDALADSEDRFVSAMSPVTSIVTSHGSIDRGQLDPSPGDDRYTAFEGAGAISRWTLTLDPRDNACDLSTVTDVVLHVEYSGDQGGPALVDAARAAVDAAVPAVGRRLYALEAAYPAHWFRFLHPDEGQPQVLAIRVGVDDLPFLYRRASRTRRLGVLRADLVVVSAHAGQFDVRVGPPGVDLPGTPAPASTPMTRDPAFGGLHHVPFTWASGARDLLGTWQFQIKRDADADFSALPDGLIEHAWLLLQFEVTG